MLRFAGMIACAVMLAGCAAPPPPVAVAPTPNPELAPGYQRPKDDAALAAARASIVKSLKDPDSARFTDLVRKNAPNARGESTDVVCGMINARNSYGGMTGAKRFVYFVARNESNVAEGDYLNQIVVQNFCVGFR